MARRWVRLLQALCGSTSKNNHRHIVTLIIVVAVFCRDLLSEYDYWQFWRNTADADVIRFLKLFTEVSLEQIREYEKLDGAALNDVKVVLADEATKLLHGADCLPEIHATIKSLFSKSGGEDLSSLPQISLSVVDLQPKEDGPAILVADLLVKADMTASKGEARRLIKAGGVRVQDEKVSDEYAFVKQSDFDSSGRLKLSSGKKKHAVVLWPSEQ